MSAAHDGVKRCSKCRRIKKVDEYYKNASTTDGYMAQCIDCRKQMDAERSRNTPAENDGKPYTTHDLKVLARTDLTIMEMARRLGRSYTAIANARQKYGLASKQGLDRYEHLTQHARAEVVDWFAAHGAPSTLLYKARQRFDIPHNDPVWIDQSADPRRRGNTA